MNIGNAKRLLGLTLIIGASILGINQASATILTEPSTVTVTPLAYPNVNDVIVTWTDGTDDATAPVIVSYKVELFSDAGYTISVGIQDDIPVGTQTATFTGLNAGTTYYARVLGNVDSDGDTIKDSFTPNTANISDGSGATNTDITAPLVTGSTTNINNGGSTTKTLIDQYVESCTATDNDVNFSGLCTVQLGGINTSVLGLQSVTYQATDPSSNTGTDTISTTIVTGGVPSILLSGANPQVLVLNQAYTELGATASDPEDGVLTGSIVIDSSAVNVNAIGSYIVTYDVTDSSGNTDHQERTVNVILGNAPVITVLGEDGIFLPFGYPSYNDAGATCSDVEDGDLTGSIITTGLPISTVDPKTNQITYSCTDSSGNTSTAFRSVTIGEAPHSDSCSGDCEAPTLGLTKSGFRAVDNGITVITSAHTWTKDAVPFFTPMELLNADVGQMVTVQTKIYDNSGKDNIRHAELGIGAKHIGDKNANARIEVDRSWDGTMSINVVDPNHILTDPITGKHVADALWDSTNCKLSTPNAKDCALVTYRFIVREPIHDYVLVTDVWDSYRYNQVTWFNHGIKFSGDSMNPLHTFTARSADGHTVIITEDNYLGDTATDPNGNRYVLDSGLWRAIVDKPQKPEYQQLLEADLEDQQNIATGYFDSSTIQSHVESSKTIDYFDYGRLHDSSANMYAAQLAYELSKPGTVNHSSHSLE